MPFGWGSWIRTASGFALLPNCCAIIGPMLNPSFFPSKHTLSGSPNDALVLIVIKKIRTTLSYTYLNILAGVVGFEPTHAGFRDQSLTAWRYPIEYMYNTIILVKCQRLDICFLQLIG